VPFHCPPFDRGDALGAEAPTLIVHGEMVGGSIPLRGLPVAKGAQKQCSQTILLLPVLKSFGMVLPRFDGRRYEQLTMGALAPGFVSCIFLHTLLLRLAGMQEDVQGHV